jgi:hypothetical protein
MVRKLKVHIFITGNVSLIEVEGSQEMESESVVDMQYQQLTEALRLVRRIRVK